MDGYLDIETTGLLTNVGAVPTVVGVAVDREGTLQTHQLVGADITVNSVLDALRGVDKVYTFNGARFDLPFLRRNPGVNIFEIALHEDLRTYTDRVGMRGGLKAIERRLGILRSLPDMDGADAVVLWNRYKCEHDDEALQTLLQYNKEDCENLYALRQKLEERRRDTGGRVRVW